MLPLPCSVTVSPGSASRSGPAFAVGGVAESAATTVTVTESASVSPSSSVTVRTKRYAVPTAVPAGTAKFGSPFVGSDSVTSGPSCCTQRCASSYHLPCGLVLPRP